MPGRRPERVRTKSTASISTRSPSTPWLNLPPAGPSSTSSNGWPWMVGPFGDDVGDEAAVVIGGEVHRPVDGGVDVDAMGPDVTGEADVEQVLERGPTDRRTERERQVPRRGRGAPPPLDRLRADGPELGDELVVRQVGALADLQLVEAVDPVMRVDLLVEGHARAEAGGRTPSPTPARRPTRARATRPCGRPTRCSPSAAPTRRG